MQDLKAVVASRQIVAQDLERVVASRQIVAQDLKAVVASRQIVTQDLKRVVASRQIVAQDLKALVASRQIVAQDLKAVVAWQATTNYCICTGRANFCDTEQEVIRKISSRNRSGSHVPIKTSRHRILAPLKLASDGCQLSGDYAFQVRWRSVCCEARNHGRCDVVCAKRTFFFFQCRQRTEMTHQYRRHCSRVSVR